MYSRDKIGLADDLILMPGEGAEITSVESDYPFAIMPAYQPPIDYSNFPVVTTDSFSMPPAVQQPTSSWSWSDIFKPAADILTAGATAFSKIYPAIKGTGYPSPYPQTPSTKVPAGYRLDPATGRLVPLTAQAGLTASPYFWPIVLGGAAFFLMTKKR